VSSIEFHHNALHPNQPSPSDSGDRAEFRDTQPEHFVDATVASEFLSITRKYLLKLSRLGIVPAHPLGIGSRKQWRYRISELEKWGLSQSIVRPDNDGGSPRAAKRGK
jgi:hypothetical protein